MFAVNHTTPSTLWLIKQEILHAVNAYMHLLEGIREDYLLNKANLSQVD